MNKNFPFLYGVYHLASNLRRSKNILKKCGSQHLTTFHRKFSSCHQPSMKVTVIGALGKMGQPVCLMLKQSPLINELCLHDIKPTNAFAQELSHVDTNCKATSFTGKDSLPQALENSKIVVIAAGSPDANLLSIEKMWLPNAQIVKDIVGQIAKTCPKAFLAMATNPINSLVPMASEILKKGGCYNPNTVFGITTSHSVRANTFAAQVLGLEPECVMVPVVGGHSEETIIPVLSNTQPCAEFTNEELETITSNVKKAHENLLKLKPPETPSLTFAFAVTRFVLSLVKAIRGYPEVVESAYVASKIHPQLKYLSNPLLLGPTGIAKNLGLPKLSDFESCMFDNAIPSLISDIKRGEKFVGVVDPAPCNPCDSNPKAPRCPTNWC